MAYDRFDRDERSRWSDDRSERGLRGDHRGRDDRGFWDRASDEVASWFGDDDADRRRREDEMRDERDRGHARRSDGRSAFATGYGRDSDRDRELSRSRERSDWGDKFRTSDRSGFDERSYNPDWRGDFAGRGDRDFNRSRASERDYRPMTGDYGRGTDHESDQFFAASGYGRGERGVGDSGRDHDRSQTPYGRDDHRRTSGGRHSDEREFDPHYRSWRHRHMSDLDRDYDDYRRENQSRFENDFTSWREHRQHKRGLLGRIREHMEVVGKDDEHVGTVDCTRGDRLILTKSDPESGGKHHSLSCSDIDRVEGDRVILDCKADEAKNRWRDESRDRALFERDGQGEMGPRNLNRSFEGTYR